MVFRWKTKSLKNQRMETYCITGSLAFPIIIPIFFSSFPLATVPLPPAVPFDYAATSLFHVVFKHRESAG